MRFRIVFPEGKNFLGANAVMISDEDAEIFIRQIFAQKKISAVKNALDRMNKKATPEQVKQIADSLYDEIFEHDELYWEMEDKNILYLAEQNGLKDAWEIA